MVIVDTTVWVDYLRGVESREALYLEAELGREPFGVLDIILCEVLQGIREESAVQQVQSELKRCVIFQSGGEELAIAAAKNYRTLKKRGFTVRKTIDCWIATFCLQHGLSLLHRDRDFNSFEQILGLHVVYP